MGRANHKTGEAVDASLAPKEQVGNPFGKPSVIEHKKEDGGKGICMDEMISKPMEKDFVEPMQRSNPEYLEQLKNREIEIKNQTLKQVFGAGMVGQVIGASPNSPQAKAYTFY